MKEPKIIALDCDHVLLDYNKAWAALYKNYFKKELFPTNHKAYYASHYWGVDWIGREHEEQEFYDHFTHHGWRDMKAMEGAIEATHLLHDAGYKIFVVTRMPPSGEVARSANLYDLGFKFDAVIGTGDSLEHNPKKPYIEALKPNYFVDDMISNFTGIDTNRHTKLVWLDIGLEHAENDTLRQTHEIDHIHNNLLDFVTTNIKK
jgi:phosphoglycolate phosphatase-like HAD superfamily hydrolase